MIRLSFLFAGFSTINRRLIMSTVMSMEWPGLTPEQYTQVMRALDFDTKAPAGGVFHVAGFRGDTLRVMDIWESQKAFEKFQKERLVPALQKVGITSQPKVQFFPVHNIYTPNIEMIRKAGSSAMPTAA
jgi:hypothetical protein